MHRVEVSEPTPPMLADQQADVGVEMVQRLPEVTERGVQHAQELMAVHLQADVVQLAGQAEGPLSVLQGAGVVAEHQVVAALVRQEPRQPAPVPEGDGQRLGLAEVVQPLHQPSPRPQGIPQLEA